jgi:hypothetical protein
MNLRFFVIYTPQTFSILKSAVQSMHHFSDYHFTLVGNGIGVDEVEEITEFCQQSNRYTFLDLPGNVTVPHGTALMHLLKRCEDPYFCFMDSDIFASGEYAAELEAHVKQADVFSSCKPLEWLNKKSVPGYRGHNTISPSGLGVATTYFSVYQKVGLVQTLDKYKVSLERYMRAVQVPSDIAQLLAEKDKHTWKFNTGKLVNLLQSMDGMTFRHDELENVFHLGGVSRFSEHSINDSRNDINQNNTQALDRLAVREYFHALLSHLNDSAQPMPNSLSLHNQAFQQVVLFYSEKIESIFQLLSQPGNK